MINKKCDTCKKEILKGKEKESFGWSEWCLFHYRKRRDFCSLECFKKWVDEYFKDKDESKKGKEEKIHYLKVLKKNDSVFQPEIREALQFAIEALEK